MENLVRRLPDEIFRLKPRKIVPICKGAGRYFRVVYSTNR
jgi:hypothetical protein